jgi:integrase
MVTDVRKMLDSIGKPAGWKAGEIRAKMFRHAYCSARLQTLDNGQSVSTFLVGRELGHSGDTMVQRVYAHLGKIRHQSKHVEFRVSQHRKLLKDRLKALSQAE